MRPDLGIAALAVASTGLASGLFLAFHYAPTLDAAQPSLRHLESNVMLGSLLRGVHHWCGTVALVLAALHGWRVSLHGGYLPPRRRLWVLGCGLALVLLAFAYTGYLLPGDERAFTGLTVLESVAESTPLVGREAAAVLVGGDAVSSATLTRIHAVHVLVLPALLVLLVLAYLREWRRAGPLHHRKDTTREVVSFDRSDVRIQFAAVAVAIVATVVLAWLLPPALGPKADPAGAGAADARPEWFFLWVNELLHEWPGSPFVVAALLPAAVTLLLVFLPWIHGSAGRRVASALVLLVIVLLVVLTAQALHDLPESEATEEPPPAEPVPEGADLEARVAPVLKRFRCASCHAIDGAETDGFGPPLDRARFPELYTRAYFRLKVGDPLAFWSETGMVYRPRRLKPTAEQLDLLEAWFFDPAK